MSEQPHIVVVDDDARIRATLKDFLELRGFSVGTAEGGTALRRSLALRPADHRKRANYNESFARWLKAEKSKWPSWTMTAIFYSAVHHAQTLLVHNGIRPRDHGERRRWWWAFSGSW